MIISCVAGDTWQQRWPQAACPVYWPPESPPPSPRPAPPGPDFLIPGATPAWPPPLLGPVYSTIPPRHAQALCYCCYVLPGTDLLPAQLCAWKKYIEVHRHVCAGIQQNCGTITDISWSQKYNNFWLVVVVIQCCHSTVMTCNFVILGFRQYSRHWGDRETQKLGWNIGKHQQQPAAEECWRSPATGSRQHSAAPHYTSFSRDDQITEYLPRISSCTFMCFRSRL